ncbi:MAG: glycosyltransferase family 2 protein [Bacteroidales bacterium]|nr:glycosyltransferase [Bacteroidales bacterium]MDD4492171.1 glycosyltransferase family 2 protein [Bacteroidales bacterium]
MAKSVNCFIPYRDKAQVTETINGLRGIEIVDRIYLLATDKNAEAYPGYEMIQIDSLKSTETVKKIAAKSDSDYSLIYTKESTLVMGMFALERMVGLGNDTGAAMLYADHYQIIDEKRNISPVITYQQGSLRDDFNFGSVLLYKSAAIKEAAARMTVNYKFAGQYDLRLKASQKASLEHVNEYMYTEVENDTRKSGEKIFDYVDPKNRAVQIEMEEACTDHLKAIGGYLKPEFRHIEFNENNFEFEASVIIPVFNRIKTVEDAIASVLKQKTKFKFNLIIIDNHSTDGTYEAIEKFAGDDRLVHLVPERRDLGIGGCWNAGVHHPKCGKFAVQLDSDDIYSDENTLQKVVDSFYEQNCAMVVGTYMMTNFNMEMIAPGIIDHKEWTPDNGRNNALRINGLGAPRAFYTPVLRAVKVPNTSYGEDYALGLNISREYQIGRIYDVLYHCRRWDGNSDAALDIVKMNAHNTYKDRIRTWELMARIKQNKNSNRA